MICKKLLCLLNMDDDARKDKVSELSDYEREELLLEAVKAIEDLDNESNFVE